jgi:cell division protein FtsW (lipid II flippase)
VSASTAEITLSRHARGRERNLLILGIVIVMAAYALVGLAEEGEIPAGTAMYGLVLAGLAAVAHVAVRKLAPLADPVILPVAFILNGLGLVFIRRLDFAHGSELALAQTRWTVFGIGLFALALLLVTDVRRLARYQYIAGLLTVVLLLLPLLPAPIGREISGARIWISLGPLNFQPGEIAKLSMIVFLAGYLERNRALLRVATNRVGPFLLPSVRHLAPVLAAAIGAIGIQVVLQNDLGMSLLFYGSLVVMLYVATGRLAYPALGMAVFGAAAYIAYHSFAHVRPRFEIWLDPWQDVTGAGYQLAQSLFALGTGGITGAGLGLGHPTIPEAATDAIFSVIGEELGLLGATAVLLCYVIIVSRTLKAALIAGDEVGTLMATGLATIIGIQVFLIVGGLTRLIPLTGITLPFVSYGGSSLVANYLLVALVLRISDTGRQRARTEQEAAA